MQYFNLRSFNGGGGTGQPRFIRKMHAKTTMCEYALRPNVQDRLRDQRGVLAVSLTFSPGDSSSYKLWKYEPGYRSVAPLSSHVLRPHRMYVAPPVQCKIQQSVAYSLTHHHHHHYHYFLS